MRGGGGGQEARCPSMLIFLFKFNQRKNAFPEEFLTLLLQCKCANTE